jgi:hypothetical protein
VLHYRLYFLDEQRHIARAIVIEGADDRDAIAQATAKGDGRAMELWQETTRVKCFRPRSGAPPS